MHSTLSEESQSAPSVIECGLSLAARSSVVSRESKHPYSPDQSRELSIDLSAVIRVDGRERIEPNELESPNPQHGSQGNPARQESRITTVETEAPQIANLTSPTDEKPTNQPAQNGLFWPFNRSELHVGFEIILDQDTARYLSFDIAAPMGRIKGTRVRREE